MHRIIWSVCAAGAVFLLSSIPRIAASQSLWDSPSETRSVAVEFRHVSLKQIDNLSTLSGAWYLRGKFGSSEKSWIVVELPIARYAPANREGITAFGNLYFGIEKKIRSLPMLTEIGIRLPTAESDKIDASLLGMAADPARIGAFAPDVITISTLVNLIAGENLGFFFRARGGVLTLLNSNWEQWDDVEAGLLMGSLIGFTYPKGQILVGVEGLWALTEEVIIEKERSVVNFGIGASYRLGPIETSLAFHVPMTSEFEDYVERVVVVQFKIVGF